MVFEIVACRGRGEGKGCEVGGGRGAEAARAACTHHDERGDGRCRWTPCSAVLPPQVFDELRAEIEHHLMQAGRHRTIISLHQQKLRHEVALREMRGAAASAAARGSAAGEEEWFEEAPRAAQAPPKRSRAEIDADLSDWADMFASGSDDSSDSEEDEDDARRVRVRDIDGLIDDEPIPLAQLGPHPAQLNIQAQVSAAPPLLPPTPCLSNKQN